MSHLKLEAQRISSAQVAWRARGEETNLFVLLPTTGLREHFNEISEPLLEQTYMLQRQSTELGKARDLLLPRLMNGEIEV